MKLKPLTLAALLTLLCVTHVVHAQRIFWNEPNNNRIRFGGLTYDELTVGTNLLTVALPGDVTLDPTFSVIFYTENNGNSLWQAEYNGDGAFERYIHGSHAEATDIAYSVNAGGVYATIYEEAQGILFIPETAGSEVNLNLEGRGGHVFTCVAVDDGSERIFFYDETDGVIGYSSFADDGVTDLNIPGLAEVIAMDFDDATNRLVYATINGDIVICDDDGGNSITLATATADVTSVIYYSGYNKVYFVSNERIWSVNANAPNTPAQLLSLVGTGVTNLGVEPDRTNPTVTSRYPANGQTGITASETFTLDFNEQIRKSEDAAVGSQRWVRVIRSSDAEPMDTIDRDDPRLSFTEGTLTISGAEYIGSNTEFNIRIGNRVVEDMAGNNFTGYTTATQWTFTTGAIGGGSKYYSRQSGNFDDFNTWSHESHSGAPVSSLPGTGDDVEIGPGHTVTMVRNESVTGGTDGFVIMAGGTLDMNHLDLNVAGKITIEGTILQGGTLSGEWNLFATQLPVFDQISAGIENYPNRVCMLNCNVVSYAPVASVDGGTLDLNGFEVCTPPTTSHTPVYTYSTYDVINLTWTASANTLIVLRDQGVAPVNPQFEAAYTANANFGDGDDVGGGNFVVYAGTGNSMKITGLEPLHTYEVNMYGYNSSIGGCYSLNSYQSTWFNSCAVVDAPTSVKDSAYCSGDTKVPVVVYGGASMVNWYDAPTGGNLVPGVGGTDALGGLTFLPTAASGTFYAEKVEWWNDVPGNCVSKLRTPVTLTMRPALVAGAATGIQNVCTGGDPTMLTGGTASGGNSSFTYDWVSATSSGGPYTSVGASGTGANFDPPSGLTQTTYYLRRVSSKSCAVKNGNEIAVTVVAPPSITTAPQNRNICGNAGTTFSVVATGTTLTYQWQVDNGGGFANVNNGGVYTGATTATLAIANPIGLNGFKYRCIVTAAAACPVTTAFGTLMVNPIPVALDQTVQECETVSGSGTANINLTDYNTLITGGAASTTVTWYDDDTYTNVIASPTTIWATDGRTYYPRVTGPNTCTDDAVLTVDIITAPEVTIHPDKDICSGASTGLTFASSPAGATYSWTITPNANITGASAGSGSSIDQALTNSSTAVQTLTYHIIPTLGACDGPTFTQNVIVQRKISAFNVLGSGERCPNDDPHLVLDGSEAGITYKVFKDNVYTGVSASGMANGDRLVFNHGELLAAGTFTMTASVSDQCPVPMNGSAVVTMLELISGTGTVGGPSQLCIGQEQTYTVAGINGAEEYLWTLPAGVEALSPSESATITIVITSEIVGATILVTPFNQCGAGLPVEKPVGSLPLPQAEIVGPETIFAGEPTDFGYFSSSTLSSVLWSFGDGQTSQDEKPTVTYAAGGNYNVDLEVTDNIGCTNTIRKEVEVKGEAEAGEFAVKNVITPNGDGMNDQLIIENIEQFPDNEVILIDRWGAEVFRKKNYDNSWEFKKGDQYLPAGNYVCVLKTNGKSYSRTITVLKQN